MSERIAAIDLGTNTFHLLIADVADHHIMQVAYAEEQPVKLGEGGIANGTITDAAFERGLRALSEFHESILKYKVNTIRAVGTAALRTAENGTDFINQVREKTQIEIEIIDGDHEAELIYQGVNQAVKIAESSLIMDIGGGSVEFIFVDPKGIKWKKSYPIGAAKLMAMFHQSDPITNNDINILERYLDEILADLHATAEQFKPRILIGSAGAFETFAALCLKTKADELNVDRSFTFNMANLNSVILELLKSNKQERDSNEGIRQVRKDMIVVASVLTRYVINKLGISSVQLSTFALKEGLLVG